MHTVEDRHDRATSEDVTRLACLVAIGRRLVVFTRPERAVYELCGWAGLGWRRRCRNCCFADAGDEKVCFGDADVEIVCSGRELISFVQR